MSLPHKSSSLSTLLIKLSISFVMKLSFLWVIINPIHTVMKIAANPRNMAVGLFALFWHEHVRLPPLLDILADIRCCRGGSLLKSISQFFWCQPRVCLKTCYSVYLQYCIGYHFIILSIKFIRKLIKSVTMVIQGGSGTQNIGQERWTWIFRRMIQDDLDTSHVMLEFHMVID